MKLFMVKVGCFGKICLDNIPFQTGR